MIPVSQGVQVKGIGRCFATTVDHNVIYLTCPALRANFMYDVNFGTFQMIWGGFRTSLPVVYGKYVDEGHITFRNWTPQLHESQNIWEQNGWSNSLALDAVPTEVSTIVGEILDPKKEAKDVEKSMVQFAKVKVKRYQSDGSWHFVHGDNEWDLERCLHEVWFVKARSLHVTLNFDHSIVLDRYATHLGVLFPERSKQHS